MAVLKSDQRTNQDKVPAVMLEPNEMGKVRAAYFSFTVPTGNAAIGDTIQLVKLPKDSRILGGRAAFEAMSTGAGVADMQVGISGTAGKYLGATSVDAAGASDFANTVALNLGEKLAAETTIIATVGTEAWAAGKKLLGYVLYVVS